MHRSSTPTRIGRDDHLSCMLPRSTTSPIIVCGSYLPQCNHSTNSNAMIAAFARHSYFSSVWGSWSRACCCLGFFLRFLIGLGLQNTLPSRDCSPLFPLQVISTLCCAIGVVRIGISVLVNKWMGPEAEVVPIGSREPNKMGYLCHLQSTKAVHVHTVCVCCSRQQ